DFQQTHGATFRLVVDVGEWDNSIAMNSPGQSGDPNSKHYDDLFEKWANDEAFPLLYSREKVEEETEQYIILVPDSDTNVESIQGLVEHFEEEGEFTDEKAPHSLKLHLTAVSHFEDQGDSKKVVKHIGGFKALLDNQKENEKISTYAYNTLTNQANKLIEKWE